MLRTKPVVSNQFAFFEELVKKHVKPVITSTILHPGKREQGVSFNRREQMRRNKAQYGKRQIRIEIREVSFGIERDYHMPFDLRKVPESPPLAKLEAYQASLYTSGYRLLSASPTELIYQYEGRVH